MNTAVFDQPARTNRHSADASSALVVRRLDEPNMARWDQFVGSCPQATFFHRAGWKSVLERAFAHRTHFLFAEIDGTIDGVLPLAEIKSRLFGHSLSSLPFCAYGGIAASSDLARAALDRAAQELARQLNVEHLEYRNLTAMHPDWSQKDLYVTFRKEMFQDEERNLSAIPRKQRAMVRKGIKAGLSAKLDPDANRFYALYADNWHRHGTPALPKRYFELLLEIFERDCDVLSVVDAAGRPVSSVLSFYCHTMPAMPSAPASSRQTTSSTGNSCAMRWPVVVASSTMGAVRSIPAPITSRKTGASNQPLCAMNINCIARPKCRSKTRSIRSTACSSRFGGVCRVR
jgi:FemAB-related protein (PEP-CTERM system-associated)